MCGISGIWRNNNSAFDLQSIERMKLTMSHRGPDGNGTWCSKGQKVILGHNRLSILDYSGAALPILATRYGVSPHLRDDENVLFCDTKSDWLNNLEQCNKSKELREKLGKNSRKMVEEFHTINSSYIEFKSLFKSL